MFTPEILHSHARRKPFVPFRVITSLGDHYYVHHPALVMVGKGLLFVGTPSAEDPTVFNEVDHVLISDITAVEELTNLH
jgi:hypothetical protein